MVKSLNKLMTGVGFCVMLGSAHAATISCPNPVGSFNRVYQTTSASDCVYGSANGNIGQGNPANDEFLQGLGTNDVTYGDSGPTFGKTWTTIDSVDYAQTDWTLNGLSITNYDDDSFNWSLTNTAYGSYALGLKDGGDPKWAVFLLTGTSGLAEITSRGGSWSHVVLYGSGTPGGGGPGDETTVPEPASLALVGLGLLGAAVARRRQSKSAKI